MPKPPIRNLDHFLEWFISRVDFQHFSEVLKQIPWTRTSISSTLLFRFHTEQWAALRRPANDRRKKWDCHSINSLKVHPQKQDYTTDDNPSNKNYEPQKLKKCEISGVFTISERFMFLHLFNFFLLLFWACIALWDVVLKETCPNVFFFLYFSLSCPLKNSDVF